MKSTPKARATKVSVKAKARKRTMKCSNKAKGKRAKALVYAGRFTKTQGGLTKEHLVKSKRGKVVGKRQQARGFAAYANIKPWVQAFMSAREALGLLGFVPPRKGTALYNKAKELYGA